MVKYNKSPESALFETASLQQGFFTTSQAIEAGYKDNTHIYHVRMGDWIREWRGIYRLARYPLSEEAQYVCWSLWSKNRQGITQGVYSHQTALSLFDLSDAMPAKIHMTVNQGFRRHSKIPEILVLHSGIVNESEIEERAGFFVTTPVKTIVDLVKEMVVSTDILMQAYNESMKRGLINKMKFLHYRKNAAFNALFESLFGE